MNSPSVDFSLGQMFKEQGLGAYRSIEEAIGGYTGDSGEFREAAKTLYENENCRFLLEAD